MKSVSDAPGLGVEPIERRPFHRGRRPVKNRPGGPEPLRRRCGSKRPGGRAAEPGPPRRGGGLRDRAGPGVSDLALLGNAKAALGGRVAVRTAADAYGARAILAVEKVAAVRSAVVRERRPITLLVGQPLPFDSDGGTGRPLHADETVGPDQP